MEAKDCGCQVHQVIKIDVTNCRYPALLAENAELKHCKECDISGGYHETFCSKVLWACNHAHNLLNARDVLVPELTAKVEKLEQERDALAGEVRLLKEAAEKVVFDHARLTIGDHCNPDLVDGLQSALGKIKETR